MKRLLILFLSAVIGLACDREPIQSLVIEEEIRSVPTEISRVFISDDLRFTFTQDSTFFVKARATEGHLPFIRTETQSETLFASTVEGGIPSAYKEVVLGGYPVTFIKNDSRGIVRGTPIGQQLEVFQNGLGFLDLDLECESLELTVSSPGPVKMEGFAERLSVIHSDHHRVDCLELESNIAKVVNNGSGDVYVWATDVLSITINGTGDVYYRSGVDNLVVEINGLGQAIELP
jgi:hypothetical protein